MNKTKVDQSIIIDHPEGMSDESLASALEAKTRELREQEQEPVEPKPGEVWEFAESKYLVVDNNRCVSIPEGYIQYTYVSSLTTRLGHISDFLKSQPYDDTVRTYNSEPASEFGLDGRDAVLCWDKIYVVWYICEFSSLEKGDQWRKQPPAPEKEDSQ